PQRRLGLLQVGMPDRPTRVVGTAGRTGLLQALCASVDNEEALPADRGDYAQNRWAALRFGARAELIHPDGSRLVRAPELARELLDLVAPAAEKLGTEGDLAALDPSTCEGERQLDIAGREDLEAVCADLLERTLG